MACLVHPNLRLSKEEFGAPRHGAFPMAERHYGRSGLGLLEPSISDGRDGHVGFRHGAVLLVR